MDAIRITIATDFSDAPGGRYIKEGPFSGEAIREEILKPSYKRAIEENKKLFIDLDGCYGFPSSFLDESFGGIAREYGCQNILKILEFKSLDQPSLVEVIKNIVEGKR